MDLRPWDMGRPTMRDPRHPDWPEAGERTELRDVAERWKWEYVDLAHGKHRRRVLGQKQTKKLGAAITEYLEHRLNTVARSTVSNDRTALNHLLDDFGTGAAVHSVDPQRTLSRLLREGYKPYTVEVYSAFLASFWGWQGLTYPDVDLPDRAEEDVRVWTDEEVAAIRAAAGDLLLAVDCALYLGLRRGEVWGLRWEDFGDGVVRVQRQMHRLGRMKALKGKRARTAAILPGWEHPPGEGLVCQELAPTAQQKRLRDMLESLGLYEMGVGWHSLRHTYARMFLERVPDIRLLQASLGHASVTTTEQAYNWLLPDKAAELARQRLADL